MAVTPSGPAVTAGPLVATVMAMAPENIVSFGDCTAPGNPACANPTKQGPCKPMIAGPWEPGSITWYVDGHQVFRYTGTVPSQAMYFLADLAVSGSGETPNASTPTSASFDIASVQIFQS